MPSPANLLKRDSNTVGLQLYKKSSNTGVFLWNLQNFYKHLFLQNTPGGCFCTNVAAHYISLSNYQVDLSMICQTQNRKHVKNKSVIFVLIFPFKMRYFTTNTYSAHPPHPCPIMLRKWLQGFRNLSNVQIPRISLLTLYTTPN